LQEKPWTDFVRTTYSGASDSDDGMRVCLPKDHPNVDKVEFEREYCRVDFDLDLRDEMGQRVQRYRAEEVERLLDKVFQAGIGEGKRQVRAVLREVIGLEMGR
jgi:hypothetical protein